MPRKLRVDYRSEDAFRTEYAQNISKGGVFIPTRTQLEMREHVEVELVLSFSDESVVLPGEVVHCIPPEMADTGAQPGVAIQFLLGGEELRGKLESFAGGTAARVDERAQGTGRRVAPRSRARVSAKIEIGGKVINGHTRNIGSSGVLVAIPGPPPPVGRKLEIRIDHPNGEEQVKVPGSVARHVEASGMTCIGIRFQVPEARRDEVEDFVDRVRAAEHARTLGGIHGPIAELGIRSVLLMFGKTAPEGMLTVSCDGEEGYITMEGGRLQAQLGTAIGREALDAMLAWDHGSFEFEAQPDDGLVDGPEIPVEELGDAAAPTRPAAAARPVAPAAPQADAEPADDDGFDGIEFDHEDFADEIAEESDPESEEEPEPVDEAFQADDDDLGDLVFEDGTSADADPVRADAASISPGATLRATGRGDRSGLGKTEEAVLDLAAAGMTVAKAVEIIPEPDVEIYQAIQGLVDEGLLALD